MTSLIFNWKRVEAELRILKQSSKQRERQLSQPLRCLKVLKDVGMFVGEMFTDASGEVCIGLTNITGTTQPERENRS